MPAPEHPSKPFSSVGHSLHVHLPYCEYILAEPARSFAGSLSLAPPSSRWNVHGVFTSFFFQGRSDNSSPARKRGPRGVLPPQNAASGHLPGAELDSSHGRVLALARPRRCECCCSVDIYPAVPPAASVGDANQFRAFIPRGNVGHVWMYDEQSTLACACRR